MMWQKVATSVFRGGHREKKAFQALGYGLLVYYLLGKTTIRFMRKHFFFFLFFCVKKCLKRVKISSGLNKKPIFLDADFTTEKMCSFQDRSDAIETPNSPEIKCNHSEMT